MPVVRYAREQQGYRVFANPNQALHGLGAQAIPMALADPNCSAGMPYDVNGNLCAGVDPNCAQLMPYDVNGNPCPGTPVQPSGTGTPASPSPTVITPQSAGPSTAAGAPTGSYLLYSATWQIPSSHAFSTPAQILASVLQALKASQTGFQVGQASQSGGLLTVSNFNVQIQLFVNGPGFAQPNDAGSFVDSAYNRVTGLMPVVSSTVVTSLPAGVPSSPAPTGTSPFPTGTAASFTTWFEQNALWIGLGIAGIVLLPRLVK